MAPTLIAQMLGFRNEQQRQRSGPVDRASQPVAGAQYQNRGGIGKNRRGYDQGVTGNMKEARTRWAGARFPFP